MKFSAGVLDFLGEDGFQARAATQVEAEGGEIGKGSGKKNGGGLLLASEIGFGALLIQDGKSDALGPDEIEGGGATNFLESLTKEFFLAGNGSGTKEGQELTLFGPARSDFRKGGHGITADFLGGVSEEGEEPKTNGFFEVGLLGFGKAGANGPDQGDRAELFVVGGLLKTGHFFLPKAEPGKSAEFAVKIFGEVGDLLGHE